jgi:nicotinate-nucleotide adenylyltransferase
MRTLLVFGGSFDPVHDAHFLVPFAGMAMDFKMSGRLLYVPAARSPHKATGPVASDEHRVGMLQAFTQRSESCAFWTDEIDRAKGTGPSYTIHTLERLRSVIRPTVTLRLVIGMDQALRFHTWRRPRDLIAIAEPYVLPREGFVPDGDLAAAMDRGFWSARERQRWNGWIASAPITREDNSTAIRAAIPGAPKDVQQWKTMDGLRFVPEAVANYIIAHNLYGFREGGVRSVPPGVRS